MRISACFASAVLRFLAVAVAAPAFAQHEHQPGHQPRREEPTSQGHAGQRAGADSRARTSASAADAAGPGWRTVGPGGSLPGNPRIRLEKVADGLADPVAVVSAPGDKERLFIVERPGRVRILRDGRLSEQPFLDIQKDVLSQFLEQGLYDIAFDPKYAENGFVYVHFAELLRNGDSVVVRYNVSNEDRDRIDPKTARLLLRIPQPYANHNGGELEFGPDGYLYIGVGDGGWEGDPLGAGQDLSTLLGKVLRIDVHGGNSGQPYGIPEGNPFADQPRLVQLFGIKEDEFARLHPNARPEIWAYGLRNPWKFSFDAKTGDLYLPDVGQNQWEEINHQQAASKGGVNYGWDFVMGTHCFPIQEKNCPKVGTPPVAEYSHDHGCAVIGIGVYRGGKVRDLDGVYLAGDFCTGKIWGLANVQGAWRFAALTERKIRVTGGGTGPDGTVYVTSCACAYAGHEHKHDSGEKTGALWQIVSDEDAKTQKQDRK